MKFQVGDVLRFKEQLTSSKDRFEVIEVTEKQYKLKGLQTYSNNAFWNDIFTTHDELRKITKLEMVLK